MTNLIPVRRLGSTHEDVSIIGMGGAHIGSAGSRREAVRLVHMAIDQGITFMDNCWDYHEGHSEEWMGAALKNGYRDRVFLMTKIDGRTREAAAQQIDQSLQRLGVDTIDLMQIHEVIRRNDPDRVFAPGGAIEALDEARRDGKIRYVGFTGHKDPDMHLKMLAQDYPWDTVQMPLNVLDAGFNSFQHQVLPELLKRGIGVLGMKPLAAGYVFETGAITGTEALKYALSLPVDVVITGIQSSQDLHQAVSAAADFEPLSPDMMDALLERMRPYAHEGGYERYKTTRDFDGTFWNAHWLEEARL